MMLQCCLPLPMHDCFKISDFGLSRDLEDEDYYVSKGGLIPVKWTAPEVSSSHIKQTPL